MNLRSVFSVFVLSAFTCSLYPQYSQAEESISISNAWVREAPPTAKVLAGYLDINNNSDQDITLINVESPFFKHIMLHRTEVIDGVATMRHSDEIVIAARSSFSLAPGGYHLMLMGKKVPLSVGDDIELTLLFKVLNPVKFVAKVRKP